MTDVQGWTLLAGWCPDVGHRRPDHQPFHLLRAYLDARFETGDVRFASVGARFDAMDRRFDSLDRDVQALTAALFRR
jgi:hypothetical protein